MRWHLRFEFLTIFNYRDFKHRPMTRKTSKAEKKEIKESTDSKITSLNPQDNVKMTIQGYETHVSRQAKGKRWTVRMNGKFLCYNPESGRGELFEQDSIEERSVTPLEFTAARTALLEAVTYISRLARSEVLQRVEELRAKGIL